MVPQDYVVNGMRLMLVLELNLSKTFILLGTNKNIHII
jgi:hypothetical protein